MCHKFALKIVGAGSKVTMDGVDVINEEWFLDKEVEIYPLTTSGCKK